MDKTVVKWIKQGVALFDDWDTAKDCIAIADNIGDQYEIEILSVEPLELRLTMIRTRLIKVLAELIMGLDEEGMPSEEYERMYREWRFLLTRLNQKEVNLAHDLARRLWQKGATG